MRATQKNKISYPVSRISVGWYASKSFVFSGQPRVEKVHSPDENQVSRVSGSCSQPGSLGGLTPIYICGDSNPSDNGLPSFVFLYQTGILCPYQICREIHQSRKLSIQ